MSYDAVTPQEEKPVIGVLFVRVVVGMVTYETVIPKWRSVVQSGHMSDDL